MVNVIVWRCAIVVWRHIVLAEVRQAEERHAERRREEQERLEARAAEQAEASGDPHGMTDPIRPITRREPPSAVSSAVAAASGC